MSEQVVQTDPMAGRIVRFQEALQNGIPIMFIDSVLPRHTRINYAIVGDTASENPDFRPLMSEPHSFQIGMFQAAPNAGPAYHTHDYVEVFVPLTGRWRFYYGSAPEEPEALDGEVFLEPWDVISFPPGLWRGFENVSETNSFALAILDPHDVFHFKDPHWPEWVKREAAAHGLTADESGKMIVPENMSELEQRVISTMAATSGVGATRDGR